MDGWKHIAIGEIASVYNGNSISAKEKKTHYIGLESGTPYIGTKDISFDHIINYENGILIPEMKRGNLKVAPPKSVFVCAEGGSAGRKIAHNDQTTHFGNKLYAIVPRDDTNSRYLFYYCISRDFFEAFTARKHGLIGGVSQKKFKSIVFPIPSLPDQERIVAILDEAFTAIATATANAEKNRANARKLYEKRLNAVFTQEADGWVKKRLDDVCKTFARGKSRHRPRNDPSLYGGEYPLIQTGDISQAGQVISNFSQTYNEVGLAQSKLWPKGTICVAIVGATIGESGILDFDACFPDSVIGMIVEPQQADRFFIEYVLQAFKPEIKAEGEGSARDNINLGTFQNLLFPIPPLCIQKRVVLDLRIMANKSKRLECIYEQKRNSLAELKQSILHKAFTGKLTTDPREADRALAEVGV